MDVWVLWLRTGSGQHFPVALKLNVILQLGILSVLLVLFVKRTFNLWFWLSYSSYLLYLSNNLQLLFVVFVKQNVFGRNLFQAVFELCIAHHQNIEFVPWHQTDLKSRIMSVLCKNEMEEDLVRDTVSVRNNVRHGKCLFCAKIKRRRTLSGMPASSLLRLVMTCAMSKKGLPSSITCNAKNCEILWKSCWCWPGGRCNPWRASACSGLQSQPMLGPCSTPYDQPLGFMKCSILNSLERNRRTKFDQCVSFPTF